ncbi:alpha/beta-Hydrolases superfamily protein [Perilla frutescens var. frutescens]|nr:alpha/beta-Hydrolases superfamily protein [Perilla frutescens var. frutescens]
MKLATGVLRPCNMLSASSTQSATTLRWPEKTTATKLSMSTKSWDDSGQTLSSSAASLRDKWMEFQGIKNWEGLLDPLDDDLRDEILRYGEFVEAAYRCFDFDTTSPTYATCTCPRASILDPCAATNKGYRVTSDLHATCGVQLPDWTERLPSWVSTQSSWIGYVAVCEDEDEIARLGRRDVVVAYRGTATCMEWLENLRATLTCLPDDMAPDRCRSMVQSGFLSLYTSSTDRGVSLQDSVRGEIKKILHAYRGERLSITVTGHSLGAALATLTAHDITTTFEQAPLVTVVSFGGPRVGNKSFRSQLEKSGTKVLRIVNSDDPITKVPGFVIDEEKKAKMSENGGLKKETRLSSWVQKCVEDTQWVYAEIGKELRLSSKDCPHLCNGGVATCHDLKTYLHLVDSFVSSNCPLRATAKRVLNKTEVLA